MAALDRIQVEGFKSIKQMDLALRPMNVLIGANGAGKSNFLSVFRFLNQMAESELRAFVARSGGANALLHLGRKTTSSLTIRLYFEKYGYEARLHPTPEDALVFVDEGVTEDFVNWQPLKGLDGVISTYTQLHDHAHRYGGSTITVLLDTLKGWRVYHLNDTGDSAKIKFTSNVNDNANLRTDGSNLAAILYLFQQRYPEHYANIVKTIQLAAPFFDDFELRRDPLNPEAIRLEWRQKGSDAYFNASALSDGTLRFMCLAALLMQPILPPVVLIDEPELGLHPYALVLLASMLKSAAARTQVIISTQSVPLINQFEPEDIIVVDQENGQSVFKRLEKKPLEDWLEDYSLGEIWEKNIIGGTP